MCVCVCVCVWGCVCVCVIWCVRVGVWVWLWICLLSSNNSDCVRTDRIIIYRHGITVYHRSNVTIMSVSTMARAEVMWSRGYKVDGANPPELIYVHSLIEQHFSLWNVPVPVHRSAMVCHFYWRRNWQHTNDRIVIREVDGPMHASWTPGHTSKVMWFLQ